MEARRTRPNGHPPQPLQQQVQSPGEPGTRLAGDPPSLEQRVARLEQVAARLERVIEALGVQMGA